MKAAPALAKLLAIKVDALKAQITDEAELAATAAAATRFASLSDIFVTDTTPGEHVLGTAFTIAYTQITYDMYKNTSVPTPHTVTGFAGLPTSVLEYLIEVHPSRVPAKIAALAPDLYDAFDRYTLGMRRGHLIATAYDAQSGN